MGKGDRGEKWRTSAIASTIIKKKTVLKNNPIYFFINIYMCINALRKTWKNVLQTNYREGNMIRGPKR